MKYLLLIATQGCVEIIKNLIILEKDIFSKKDISLIQKLPQSLIEKENLENETT